MMSTTVNNTVHREIIVSQLLNAPIANVWEAWTNPEHIKNWWGPMGFLIPLLKWNCTKAVNGT